MITNGPTPSITILRQPFRGPRVRQLIEEMVTEMDKTYGNPKTENYAPTPLDVPDDDETNAKSPMTHDLAFFIAFASCPGANAAPETGDAVGCVAVNLSLPGSLTATEFPDKRTAELKRLYVRPAHRALGLGQRLLDVAEAAAREDMGVELLLLETGVRQPASIKLYERNGWKKRALFGAYKWSGVEHGSFSVAYEKALVRR